MYLLNCIRAEINTFPFYLGLYRAQPNYPPTLIKDFAFCSPIKKKKKTRQLDVVSTQWYCQSGYLASFLEMPVIFCEALGKSHISASPLLCTCCLSACRWSRTTAVYPRRGWAFTQPCQGQENKMFQVRKSRVLNRLHLVFRWYFYYKCGL